MNLEPKNKLLTLLLETLNLKITPNELFALLCFKEKVAVSSSSINLHFEIRNLKALGYVTPTAFVGIDNLENGWVITEKGQNLLKEMDVLYSKIVEDVNTAVVGTSYSENIKAYNLLFPRGKLPSGKQARVNEKNLETAFKWFFKNFDYSWETVLAATALYVNEYLLRNYLYMRTSQYFIRKMSGDRSFDSELANYCEMVVTGNYDDDENKHFSDKVV